MKLYEDFAKSRAKKSMEERLSEGEKKTVRTERAAKMKKETGTVCTHVFQVGVSHVKAVLSLTNCTVYRRDTPV